MRDYARTAVGSHRTTLPVDGYAETPLNVDTLRSLRYFAEIERATMGHLRNVLVTATHKDARVTAFLSTWAYEKYWVADALALILERNAHVELPAARRTNPIVAFFREAADRFQPLTRSITANFAGEHMVGAHMAIGTIDEWMSQAALARIAELEPHPDLVAAVDMLMAVKRRQLEFFELQARDRLATSERARTIARRAVRRSPFPIGSDAEPRRETAFFLTRNLASAPALVSKLDARVVALPGLEGLTVISKAIAAAGSRS